MDVFKLEQTLSGGVGVGLAASAAAPDVSFDAGGPDFNLSFFEDSSDPGSVGSASASSPPPQPPPTLLPPPTPTPPPPPQSAAATTTTTTSAVKQGPCLLLVLVVGVVPLSLPLPFLTLTGVLSLRFLLL